MSASKALFLSVLRHKVTLKLWRRNVTTWSPVGAAFNAKAVRRLDLFQQNMVCRLPVDHFAGIWLMTADQFVSSLSPPSISDMGPPAHFINKHTRLYVTLIYVVDIVIHSFFHSFSFHFSWWGSHWPQIPRWDVISPVGILVKASLDFGLIDADFHPSCFTLSHVHVGIPVQMVSMNHLQITRMFFGFLSMKSTNRRWSHNQSLKHTVNYFDLKKLKITGLRSHVKVVLYIHDSSFDSIRWSQQWLKDFFMQISF